MTKESECLEKNLTENLVAGANWEARSAKHEKTIELSDFLPCRTTVVPRTLDPFILVRIQAGQFFHEQEKLWQSKSKQIFAEVD